MEIDKIAKLDMYLRAKNGSQNILDLDSLIISDIEPQTILKFKNSAKRLADYNVEYVEDELRETWKNLFNKQVKHSFNEIKSRVGKNTKKEQDSLKQNPNDSDNSELIPTEETDKETN